MTMKLVNDLELKTITIRWKHESGNSFATAVFSHAAIREFDEKYPHRTHVEVWVDEASREIGFKILSTNKTERHVKMVSVTKAVRILKVTNQRSQVELIFDPIEGMYKAKL